MVEVHDPRGPNNFANLRDDGRGGFLARQDAGNLAATAGSMARI